MNTAGYIPPQSTPTTERLFSTLQKGLSTMDAHHAEYAAAAAALHEQTPSPDPFSNIAPDDGSAMQTFCGGHEPAVGDFVRGTTAGRRWQGHVEWVERGFVCINVGGGWVRVPLDDITH